MLEKNNVTLEILSKKKSFNLTLNFLNSQLKKHLLGYHLYRKIKTD